MIRERIPSGLTCLLVAIGIAACADSRVAPHIDTITEASLSGDLYTLSHDSMAGRLVGTPELDRASDWIRDRFASLGLEPAGDDGTYDQRFDLIPERRVLEQLSLDLRNRVANGRVIAPERAANLDQ